MRTPLRLLPLVYKPIIFPVSKIYLAVRQVNKMYSESQFGRNPMIAALDGSQILDCPGLCTVLTVIFDINVCIRNCWSLCVKNVQI